jgi:hypothetical protein
MTEQGGTVNRKDLLAHLLRLEMPENLAKGTINMTQNLRFAEKAKGEKLHLAGWALDGIKNPSDRPSILCTLATGIISGGYAPSWGSRSKPREGIKSGQGEIGLKGTRLLLCGLKELCKENERVSLEHLARYMNESGLVSIYCLLQLLATPSESDPYALGIVSMTKTQGLSGYAAYFARLHHDVLRSYQVAVVSRFLTNLIPRIVRHKYKIDIEAALENKFDLLKAEEVRNGLISGYPSIWLADDDLDDVILEITSKYDYHWMPANEQASGRGLTGDQKLAYLQLTSAPFPIPLKNEYHALY